MFKSVETIIRPDDCSQHKTNSPKHEEAGSSSEIPSHARMSPSAPAVIIFLEYFQLNFCFLLKTDYLLSIFTKCDMSMSS